MCQEIYYPFLCSYLILSPHYVRRLIADPNQPPSTDSLQSVAEKLACHRLLRPCSSFPAFGVPPSSVPSEQQSSYGPEEGMSQRTSNTVAGTVKAALHVNMASAFALKGQLKMAEKCTRLALTSCPYSAEAVRMLVYVLLRTEQTAEALKYLKLHRATPSW